MDGQKTIDEIAADYMEAKGRIALSMIRSLTFKLWKNGVLHDPESQLINEAQDEPRPEVRFPIPGIATLGSLLYPLPGVLFKY